MSHFSSRIFKRLNLLSISLLIIAVTAFVYIAIRAAVVGFTYDEAFTYMHQAIRPVSELLTYTSDQPANIHIFTTLSVKLIAALGGSSEFVLRLPSVVAFGFYLAAVYLLVRRLKQPVFILSGFILLVANPFLLEFFSLARGYSLSLAFMLISLALLAKGLGSLRLNYKSCVAGITFAALAVISNLNWLFFYAGLISAVVLMTIPQHVYVHRQQFLRKALRIIKQNSVLIIANLLMIAYITFMALRLQTTGALYYGGNSGFISDTVGTLLSSVGYGINSQTVMPILNLVTLLGMIYLICLSLYLIVTHKVTKYRFLLTMVFTLLCLTGGAIAGHVILGIPYQTDRTALAFLPLAICCLIFGLHAGWQELQPRGKFIPVLAIALLTLLALFHMYNTANAGYVYAFKSDADILKMLQTVATQVKPGTQVKLGVEWVYESVANYYRVTRNMTWLAEIPKDLELPVDADFYYIGPYTIEHSFDPNWTVIQKYAIPETELVKPK